jgi:nucleoid-associated protein YgaU
MMSKERWRIVALAVCVAAAGLAGAWPFRRSEPPADLAVAPRAEEDLVWRQAPGNSSPPASPASDESSATAVPASTTAPTAVAPTTPAPAEAPFDPPSSSAPPPSLATSYEAAATAPEPYAPPPPTAAERASEASDPRRPSRPPLSGWRRHRIADGDTLARLAQEYLDDPAREMEIFQSNRHVLKHPEILPIGQWLRIPPRVAPSDEAARSAAGR